MQTLTEHITSIDWAEIGISAPSKRRLSVAFDETTVTIYISNSYKPPISWFLTDVEGEMIEQGQIADANYEIDLSHIPLSTYSLRIAGEIHFIAIT